MHLQLIPLDAENMDRLEHNALVNMESGSNESREFHHMIATVLYETRTFMETEAAEPPWISYLVMDSAKGGLIGNCSFKGNPNEAGEVEIGFVTFPHFEGQGYGIEMSRQLIDLARTSGVVSRIAAISQPTNDAATRVLQRHGFGHVESYTDDDHGELWEWALALG
jgi:[ribosomal protein S5]-alanine N-acetyltransferase